MKGIKQINKYTLTQEIGKGSTGKVYEATDNLGNFYAIKSISMEKLENKRMFDSIKSELKVLQMLNHENIIKIHGLEKTVNNMYLVLEYCNGGTLYDFLLYYKNELKTTIPEQQIQFLLKMIINGLYEMHKKNIIHRDIKLENILLHFPKHFSKHKIDYSKVSIYDCVIKIADLGFAKELGSSNLTSTICGSPMTMAPDIIQGFSQDNTVYDNKADLWSLGTIIYELATGLLPFNACNSKILFEKIMKGIYYYPSNINISIELISLINGLLQFYPERRYNWLQIINHPFIKNDYDNFYIIDFSKLKPTNIHNVDENVFENDSKDCGKFLWLLFQSTDINIEKIDSTKFSEDEKLAFQKKINELRQYMYWNIINKDVNEEILERCNSPELDNWEIICSNSEIFERDIETLILNEIKLIQDYFN